MVLRGSREVCFVPLSLLSQANTHRIIQAEPGNTSFPCASSPPHPNDFLPESVPTRVGDDLLLPHQVDLSDAASGLNRDFTKFGSFSAAVQATLLSELVMRHINYGSRSEQERTEDEMRLDIALQSFVGALIPGPYVAFVPLFYQNTLCCILPFNFSQGGTSVFF